jgi:hypothetical protein
LIGECPLAFAELLLANSLEDQSTMTHHEPSRRKDDDPEES